MYSAKGPRQGKSKKGRKKKGRGKKSRPNGQETAHPRMETPKRKTEKKEGALSYVADKKTASEEARKRPCWSLGREKEGSRRKKKKKTFKPGHTKKKECADNNKHQHQKCPFKRAKKGKERRSKRRGKYRRNMLGKEKGGGTRTGCSRYFVCKTLSFPRVEVRMKKRIIDIGRRKKKEQKNLGSQAKDTERGGNRKGKKSIT